MKTFKEQLEIASKLVLLMVGLCYIAGIIVVNLHLSQYGFYSLSLIEVNYITAGIWVFMPILLAIFVISFFINAFLQETTPAKQKIHMGQAESKTTAVKLTRRQWIMQQWSKIRAILTLLFIFIMLIIGIYVILNSVTSKFGFDLSVNWLIVSCLGAFVAVFLVGTFAITTRRASYSTIKGLIEVTQGIFIAFLVVLFYIALFARLLYPEIPAALGGGREIEIRLVVEATAKPLLANTGVTFPPNANVSDQVGLILTTDKEYIVLPQRNNAAVSISRESVKAVLFDKH